MRWFARHPVWTVLLALLAAVVLLVGGAAWIVWRAAHHDAASDHEHADAIVVLGAAQYNGTPSPVFQGRLDHAVLLWQQGRADIVFTVGSKQPGDRFTEAEAGRDYLIDQGVPADSVVALDIGHSTYQSLQAVAHGDARPSALFGVPGVGPVAQREDHRHGGRSRARGLCVGNWTSADASQESRAKEYGRETLAYLYYRLFGGELGRRPDSSVP